MISYRYGGSDGRPLQLVDDEDLVVVRAEGRGVEHDLDRLTERSRAVGADLYPLFGFAGSGVGVYETPAGGSQPVSEAIHADPEIEFAGRGLRDEFGAPVVYTENLFIKFADDLDPEACLATLAKHELEPKRPLHYAGNAYFAAAPRGSGRVVFEIAERLLQQPQVDLCHPELVREIGWNQVFEQQWHLAETDVDGRRISASANVEAAWGLSQGDGIVIAVIDDGVDIEHEEFRSPGKIVAPQSFTFPRGNSAHPADPGDMHGMACAGVACGDGNHGASGVAPKARLMPVRLSSGVNSQDEADAFVWAADHGADVISCSWGPTDGKWWKPDDPVHDQFVPMPDSSRLAIEYALSKGREGRGCVITWAAGNGNEDVGNDGYASHEGVIAIAACNDSGTRSVYSDMGEAIWCSFPSNDFEPPWDRGRLPLTPGIWTTDRPGADGYNPGDPTKGDADGTYTNFFGGTSSACPGAAGVVALMLARNPDLTPVEVKELLKQTCEQIDAGEGEYDAGGHSTNYGYGRIDALAAVEAAA
ncbi:MAG TPA: S8 family serine peptidase [Solirubrobacterales bacterium]|nr:S8 family serine peptidase [Solirubrobacterales bacterium]